MTSGSNSESEAQPLTGPETKPPVDRADGAPYAANMRETIVEQFSMMASGPMPNPIHQKITSEHISKRLEWIENQSCRDYRLVQQGRGYKLAYVFIAVLAFFGFALMFGYSNPDLFTQVLTYLGTFLAGFAGGWGVSTLRSGN